MQWETREDHYLENKLESSKNENEGVTADVQTRNGRPLHEGVGNEDGEERAEDVL